MPQSSSVCRVYRIAVYNAFLVEIMFSVLCDMMLLNALNMYVLQYVPVALFLYSVSLTSCYCCSNSVLFTCRPSPSPYVPPGVVLMCLISVNCQPGPRGVHRYHHYVYSHNRLQSIKQVCSHDCLLSNTSVLGINCLGMIGFTLHIVKNIK